LAIRETIKLMGSRLHSIRTKAHPFNQQSMAIAFIWMTRQRSNNHTDGRPSDRNMPFW